jgi:hypothetical protein
MLKRPGVNPGAFFICPEALKLLQGKVLKK